MRKEMLRSIRLVVGSFFVLGVVLLAPRAFVAAGSAVPQRLFEFTYQVHVPAVPDATTPLHIWVPLPQTDAWQSIFDLRIASPVPHKTMTEPVFGNRMAYFSVAPVQLRSGLDITLRFNAVRREHRVDLGGRNVQENAAPPQPELVRYLKPDRLVPTDGMIGDLSRQETEGVDTQLEKARKIYEYVIANMRYDKTGEGWGHGDAIFACTAKRGNCTDFHSLFIGMARAAGIPSRFEIGFPLPDDKTAADIPGYHCWAEFYVKGIGWVPIDASEAWKHPAEHDYFFGAHDVNRVMFTTGRDLQLTPPQQGEPLNYFVYPYAELNGKVYGHLETHFAFRDLPPAASPATQKSASR